MTASALHDSSRVIFALVPERGPVSMLLRTGKSPEFNPALRELKAQAKQLREGRAKIPALVAVDGEVAGQLVDVEAMDAMVKALSRAGFTCVGFLDGSAQAPELAEAASLMVMPAPAGSGFVDLSALACRVDAQALLEQEARDWDEALEIDAQVNAAQIAHDWAEAVAMDEAFNARKEAERLERERQMAEEEARAWDEAIAEDEAFEARLFAQVWDEAHAFNDLLERADQAAAAARQAVLDGFVPPPRPTSPSRSSEPSRAAPVARSAPRPAPATVQVALQASEYADVAVMDDPTPVIPSTTAAPAQVATPTAPARVHNARVRSGQVLHAKGGDLTVFGIVSSGAEIVADGNINAFAPVYGRVMAGVAGNQAAQVVCQEFYAEIVSIADKFVTSDELPADLQGTAVHFWLEDGSIHFRRLANLGKSPRS